MIIRLGYACISETICATSTNYTYTEYLKNHDLKKLDATIISNLKDLEKLIDYNIKNNIHFYRLSSKLIPLATKPEVKFDYIKKYQNYYKIIAKKLKKIRIDFHPDQYCVLNSTKIEVVNNSIEILKYHYNMLKTLQIKNKVLILHVGSNTFGKKNSLQRFINNFKKLPNHLKKSIVIENDDKVFNVNDCLYLSNILNIPVVLDVHHHNCNPIDNLNIEKIFKTWENINPKIHFSSPKNNLKKDFRAHNDYINVDEFIIFLEKIKNLNYNIDIMIEAKKKDEALFRLIRQIKYKTNYYFIDDTTFII